MNSNLRAAAVRVLEAYDAHDWSDYGLSNDLYDAAERLRQALAALGEGGDLAQLRQDAPAPTPAEGPAAQLRLIAEDEATARAAAAALSALPGVALQAPRLGRRGQWLVYGAVRVAPGVSPAGRPRRRVRRG